MPRVPKSNFTYKTSKARDVLLAKLVEVMRGEVIFLISKKVAKHNFDFLFR